MSLSDISVISCLLEAIKALFRHAKKAKFQLPEDAQGMAGRDTRQRIINWRAS